MYEASEPGRREWSPIPLKQVLKAVSGLCRLGGMVSRRLYIDQLNLGRWVLTPTMAIRKVR